MALDKIAPYEPPQAPAVVARQRSVVARLAERFGMEPAAFQQTIVATCFPGGKAVTREQFAAFAIVADQYGLNPCTKEVYAFPAKGGGITPIVGIDGWARLVNSHPQFDGVEFEDALDDTGELVSVTAIFHRKDRAHPIRITEYMAECRRSTEPWNSHPRRMLRHKTYIQGGRLAFGFAGIYDPDEGDRIRESEAREVEAEIVAQPAPAKARTLDELAAKSKPTQAVSVEPSAAQAVLDVEEREAALADPEDSAPLSEDDGSPQGAFAGM